MSTVDVSVILRLVNQASGPARAATGDLLKLTRALDSFKRAGGGLDILPKRLRESGAAMRGLSSDVRNFSSSFRNAADSARALTREMASGKGKSFLASEVRNAKELARLSRSIGGGSRAPGVGGLLGGFGVAYTARRMAHGVAVGLQKGGNLQQEMSMLELLGLPGDVRAQVLSEAQKTANLIPQVSTQDALHSFREMRYAFASTDHAIESMVEMAKFSAVLGRVADPDKADQAKREVFEAVKSSELKNYLDHDSFSWFLDSMVKVATSTGGRVTPGSIFQALKYSRSALHGYDKEFTSLFAPELMQELMTGKGGGGRGGAGPALANFKRMFVDGIVAKQYKPALKGAGLMDADGKMVGRDLASRNPFRYMEQYILPALKRQGVNVDDPSAVSQAIGQWGGTDIGKQMTQLMVIQRERMKERAEFTAAAWGVDKSYGRMIQLYNTSLETMKKQFDDMVSHVMLPFLPLATKIQNFATQMMVGIKKFSEGNAGILEAVSPILALGGVGLGALILRGVFRSMSGALLGGGLTFLMTGSLASAGIATGLGGLVSGFIPAFFGVMSRILLGPIGWAAMGAMAASIIDQKYGKKMDSAVDKANSIGFPSSIAEVQAKHPIRTWMRNQFGIDQALDPLTLQGIRGAVGLGDVPELKDQSQSGAQAGTSWAESFMSSAKAFLNGLVIEGPSVSVPGMTDKYRPGLVRPQNYIAPSAPAGGGAQRASLQINGMAIHVHGGGDAKQTAQAVWNHFHTAVNRQLSDGAFA
jgi:hypothetical protein